MVDKARREGRAARSAAAACGPRRQPAGPAQSKRQATRAAAAQRAGPARRPAAPLSSSTRATLAASLTPEKTFSMDSLSVLTSVATCSSRLSMTDWASGKSLAAAAWPACRSDGAAAVTPSFAARLVMSSLSVSPTEVVKPLTVARPASIVAFSRPRYSASVSTVRLPASCTRLTVSWRASPKRRACFMAVSRPDCTCAASSA
mmetsp:Transcript_3379/g.10127  ORF Transcript_3379/g.10127 Transcript_3379/m.10127 type:complete len:203 (-) Transcript_3379:712-1320(-)